MSLFIAYLVRYALRAAVFAAILGPAIVLVFGYSRDAVRLFNMRQLSVAVDLSHDRTPLGPGYPESLQSIVGTGKILSEYPQDPIRVLDWSAVNSFLQMLGVPDTIVDTHVAEENGYRYVYETSPDRRNYEISTKLESIFMASRMQQDGGNDDRRYEEGSDLKIKTSVSGTGSDALGTPAQRESYQKLQEIMKQFREKAVTR